MFVATASGKQVTSHRRKAAHSILFRKGCLLWIQQPLAVHCKSGYRSMIACSLLERAGYGNVINVIGGFDAWQAAGLPEVTEQLAKA